MSEATAAWSRKTLIFLWSIVVLTLGIAGWMQFIRDERERYPKGFHLPAQPLTWREGKNADNGLYYLCKKPGHPISWGEWTRSRIEVEAVLSGREAWNAELMRCLTDHAPAVRLVAEEALRKPAWHESPEKASLHVRDSEMVQQALLAEALNLTGKGYPHEAVSWLELGRFMDVRRAAASRELPDLTRASTISRWVNQAAFSLAAASGTDDATLARVWKILNTPVVSHDQFLAVLASEYLTRRSALAGEAVHGLRSSAGDFLPLCCTSRSDRSLAALRYQRQATCNLLTRHYSLIAEFAVFPDKISRSAASKAAANAKEESALALWSWEPNRAGRIITAVSSSPWLSTEAVINQNESIAKANALSVAVRRWSLAHGGAKPAKLSDLIPDYVPELPMDLDLPP